jgi:hypothetical protein
MSDCKHDWHFIHGTSRLECRRCKAETGPRTYDQRTMDMFQDIATIGSAWSKDGERIDPTSVYATPPEYTFAIPTPNYNITFHNNLEGGTGKQVGKLDFNGPEMIFEGDAAESAKVFVDFVARSFHGRLKDEREAGKEEARQEMQHKIDTLHDMYTMVCTQRDELMDQQRAQIEAMRGRIQ